MLERHIIKQALLGASHILAHRAEMAQRRQEEAARRASKLELVNHLIDNSRESRLTSGVRGGAQGAVMLGLPLIAPSLFYRTPAWALGGAAVGATLGGYAGSKMPQWSAEALRNYANGTRNPVFYDEHGGTVMDPLNKGERGLVTRALRGHRG